jgi:glycosyltransferase involved in cell wall biosynthesis
MKIAICVPSWPPGHSANGIVTYTSYIVPALRQLGHEVFVLTGNKVGDDDPYTIDLQHFAGSRSVWSRVMFRLSPDTTAVRMTSLALARAVRELVKKRRIDVLETEESFGFCRGILDLNLLPVLVRLHGPWFLNGRFNDADTDELSAWRIESEGRGIQDAHFVTSPVAQVLEAVKDRYKLKLLASCVIANPIKAADPSDLWDVGTCRSKNFLFVGRFNARKGGDLVLRAFADLAESDPKVRLTFVGPDDGIRGEDGNIIRLEEFVRRNVPEQHRSRVDFKGQMSHSQLMSLRRNHLAAIVASRYEIAPYSVLEGLSLGCPVIATAVGGIPELINDLRNSLLIPSQDAKRMSNACRTLLDDASLAARLGRHAWQDCRSLYDPELIAMQTTAAYCEAIEVFKSRSRASLFMTGK